MLTLIPVSSVNGRMFAAMAAVGAVFSEMKFRVAPLNWRHGSLPAMRGASLWAPHPARVSDAPAASAPRRTSRLLRSTSPAPPDTAGNGHNKSPHTVEIWA
jgi:hypothetical protein